MKKNARKWSILLILTLIFSFEGMAVFATGDDAAADQAPAAEQVIVDDQADADFDVYQSEAKAAAATTVNVSATYDSSAQTFNVSWTVDGEYAGAYTLVVKKGSEVIDNNTDAHSPATVSATADNSEYTFEVTAGDVTGACTATATKPAAPAPAVTGLVAYPGADQTSNPDAGTVTLYWDANANAVKYEVYVDGAFRTTVTNSNTRALPASAGGAWKVSYTATGLNEYRNHSFVVRAYNSENVTAQASVSKQPVRPINYVMKMKKKVSLKSHGGRSQKITLAKNEIVKAYGFNSGKYVFKRGGSIFYVAKSRGKSISSDYTTSFNYSRADAENYVNTAYIGSSSYNTLIWVSTYCQHVYYFTGSKGNWRCVNDWECSTGKAQSPSPTGMWGNKEIGKKIKKRHGIKFWSTYSSMNAFHGKLKSWKLGKPASGGCIRNDVGNAEYIYKYAPKRTKVIIG